MTNTNLVPFCFGDNLVRILVDDDGNAWWVAKDICKALELDNVTEATRYLDDDEKCLFRNPESTSPCGGNPNLLIISESGLYALVFRSRKPEAKAFSKWVRSEVLPAIRKTGRYEKPGRIARQIGATPIPEEMIEVSLGLKPAMRQRLWRDALDTARLDGGGIDLACRCFAGLCGLMSAKRELPDAESMILRFMDERLEHAKGFNTPFAKIEAAFKSWWRDFGDAAIPGPKRLANLLRARFSAYKSNVTVYRDCRLCQ